MSFRFSRLFEEKKEGRKPVFVFWGSIIKQIQAEEKADVSWVVVWMVWELDSCFFFLQGNDGASQSVFTSGCSWFTWRF